MDFTTIIIYQHGDIISTDRDGDSKLFGKQQRAGDGASPVRVSAAENHSGVSFLRSSQQYR